MSLNLPNTIKDRRSVKEYSPKEVSKEIVIRIMKASRWAPSTHNAQPWHFIVIRDPALKQKLAKDMASRWNEDMSKNGIPEENRESFVKAS